LLKKADEAVGRFTLAHPTINVPEGFEDYLLVNKKYNLHTDDTQHANKQVIYSLFICFLSLLFLIVFFIH